MTKQLGTILAALAVLIVGVSACAEDIPSQKIMPQPLPRFIEMTPPGAIEKVSAGVFRIGQVTIDKNKRNITFPAEVNMDKGLLEYLLVRNGGKTHESLLRTKVEPYHLQVACLLLGLEGTTHPLSFQGAPETPAGNPVIATFTFQGKGGEPINIKPEELLSKKQDINLAPVETISIVFTGSIVSEGRFMAQMDGSIIALYHDPIAMFDNASLGGESDKIWLVNEKTVPPVGTPVTVTIKSRK